MATIKSSSLMTGVTKQEENEEIELVRQDQPNEQVEDATTHHESSDDTDIPKRKDGGKWPSLYDEIWFHLTGSIFIYALADLRQQIRKGKITDPALVEPFSKMPVTTEELLPVVQQHKDLFNQLIKAAAGNGEETRYEYLDKLISKTQEHHVGNNLMEFNDENSDREMVYAIELHHTAECIQITFRGSSSQTDFVVDADPFMQWYPNPVKSTPGLPQDKKIGVHAGFAYYMNQSTSNLGVGKCDQIIKSVQALQKQYPHYRVCCTGHSLGGALCTLTSFVMATTDGISKPVSCISIASPKCGNNGFLRAFQALEKKGLIRHARVANHLDIIPGLPTRSSRYWHVGVGVKLFHDGRFDIEYQRQQMSYMEQVLQELSLKGTVCQTIVTLWRTRSCGKGTLGDFLRNHSTIEYAERLEAVQEKLERRSLQEVYFRQARSSINALQSPPTPSMLFVQPE